MIQITPPQNPQYWINQRALTFSENDLENVNRIAVSLVSGTVIMVYEKGVIDYAPDGNFQKWTLKGYSTRLVSDLAHKIYARLSRTEKDALIVFSINNYNIDGSITTIVTDANGNPVLDEDGKEQTTTSEPNPNYWYVKIGEITATVGNSKRELTYDSGALGTKKGEAETGDWNEMFELSKQSTPWLIFVKQMFYEFTVKNPITLLSGLIFKNNKGVEKKVTDVKRSTDSDNEYLLDEEGNPILNAEGNAVKDDSYVPVSDETIPTTKYVEEKIEGFEGKYIRKDVDDGTPHSLSVGKNLEVVGDSTVKGDSQVEGNLSSDGTLSVKGEAVIDSSLEVGGNSTTKGDSKVEGNLSSDGTLSVKGEAVIDSSLEVGGNSTTKGDSKVEGALSVDGKATFKDGFSSSGESKINGDLLLNEKKISNFTRFYDEEKPMSSDISFYSSLMTDHRIEEEIEKIDDRFLRKDKEDTAQEHITFNKGITVNDLAKLMNLEVSELATIARAIVQVIGSSKFVDGFAGEGFQIWQDIASGDWNMTLDRITVRKVMMIYELIIQKIRSVGGTIVVSAGNGRIKTIEEVGFEYKFTFEDVNTFAVGDLIRCKVYSTVGMKDYWVEVTHVVGDSVYTRISDYGDVKPEIGDEVVLMGNTRNSLRQNMILISATEDGQPRFDCMDGIKSKNFEDCLKVRVGCLDGISDDRFPSDLQPNGYGIYGNNCFLTGVFVLSNGTDVRTQFMILEGMIRSEISSVRREINQKDNYLTNSSFSSNLQSWEYNNDVRVFNTPGGLLHFNGDFYSEKRNFAGIVENGSKNVLRIKNSYIKQYNKDFNMQPTFSLFDKEVEGEEGKEIISLYKPRMFYISFKYMCTSSGKLKVRFSGENNDETFDEYTPIDYSETINANDIFSLKEISGKWNGTGDFLLSFDGDIYIYDLALADNALADLEERFTMRFEMTDQKIQANGEAIKKNGENIESYRSEFKLTAEELSTDFEKSISDTYDKVTKEYKNHVSVTAEGITTDLSKSISDTYDKVTEEYKTHVSVTAEGITADMTTYVDNTKAGLEEDYKAKIEASAKELTSAYEADIKDLVDGTIADMQTSITQNAESIETKASKTDFDALGERVTTAETSITQNAEAIETKASQDDFDALGERVTTAETNITQNATAIQARALKTDLDTLSGELETKYSELTIESEKIKTSVGEVDEKLQGAIDRIQSAEDALDAVEKKADELDEYIDGAFKDGIIDESEALSIEKYLNSLSSTMVGLESSYNNVVNHEALTGKTEKTVLVEKYGNLVTKYNELVAAINTAIADGKATDEESESVDSAFDAFDDAIDAFNDALEDARYKIASFYADKAVSLAEKALYDALPDDYKTKEGTYASALVQMAEGISAVAGRFDENGKLIEGAGWVTTAQGNELWATHNQLDELGETVKTNTSNISQQADKITTLVSETDELGTRQTTLEQTADGLSVRVTNVETGNTNNSNKISAIDVRLSAIESFVGEGGDIEGSFDSFKEALDNLAADITANTEAAAKAQKTADEAKGQSETNLTKIEQNAKDITALAGKITTDEDGNITNISTSGLVLDSEFATLFSTEVDGQGIAKTAQLSAYVLETELGEKVSKLDISADQIDLNGVITAEMLNPTFKSSLATSTELSTLQEALNNNVASLNTTIGSLQTEVSQKASIKSLDEKVSGLNEALKKKADTDLLNAAVGGSTLIVGGYLNTDLIEVGKIKIKSSQISDLSASTVGLPAWVTNATLTKALEGESIITGGYISTNLIKANDLVISSSQISDLSAASVGLPDWVTKDTVTKALEGESIISGGYINTSLINADSIVTKQLVTDSDFNGYDVEVKDGHLHMKKDNHWAITINADNNVPSIWVSGTDGKSVGITSDTLYYNYGSNKNIRFSNGSLDLDYAATIRGFAIGNVHSSILTGTTDFAVASGTKTLPPSTIYPGKVIFVKCNGSVTFKASGTDKIVKWSSNSQVDSVSADGSSLFFISNGAGLWYGFVCH